MRLLSRPLISVLCGLLPLLAWAQPTPKRGEPVGPPRDVTLADERLRDACIWADASTETYYLVSSTGRRGPNRRPAVVQYTSKDLRTWNGPHVVFEIPENFWTQRGIWAPELHAYRGKFYLFLTFDSHEAFPEQWRDWLPRVKRGSQVLVADAPTGPFKAFAPDRSTLPPDMMTLDGTLWEEAGVPHMIFCHEWVQIKDGTVEMVRLTDDLSATVGEPKKLFNGSDAPWARKLAGYDGYVTDGCWLHRLANGKLAMLWSSVGAGGYMVGLAIADSGQLAGPWRQQAEPVFEANGGHPMLFKRFDGQLMMALHQPNTTPHERIRLFEMEESGDTLRVKQAFTP